jgi:hypothetical protein
MPIARFGIENIWNHQKVTTEEGGSVDEISTKHLCPLTSCSLHQKLTVKMNGKNIPRPNCPYLLAYEAVSLEVTQDH